MAKFVVNGTAYLSDKMVGMNGTLDITEEGSIDGNLSEISIQQENNKNKILSKPFAVEGRILKKGTIDQLILSYLSYSYPDDIKETNKVNEVNKINKANTTDYPLFVIFKRSTEEDTIFPEGNYYGFLISTNKPIDFSDKNLLFKSVSELVNSYPYYDKNPLTVTLKKSGS